MDEWVNILYFLHLLKILNKHINYNTKYRIYGGSKRPSRLFCRIIVLSPPTTRLYDSLPLSYCRMIDPDTTIETETVVQSCYRTLAPDKTITL